jgi:hypothetical protein
MSETTRLQPVTDLPDHGLGGLGQVAHGVLRATRAADPSRQARLFFGLNTLPDRPFPLVAYIRFPTAPGSWKACGGNVVGFLEAGARSIRDHPVPPPSTFGPEYHRVQRLLRQDAIVMSYPAYMVLPQEDPGGRALLANLVEGYLRPGDLELSPAARLIDLVWAVERSGTRLIMAAPPDADGEEVILLKNDEFGGGGTVVLDLLADLLDAHYTWTCKVFG